MKLTFWEKAMALALALTMLAVLIGISLFGNWIRAKIFWSAR